MKNSYLLDKRVHLACCHLDIRVDAFELDEVKSAVGGVEHVSVLIVDVVLELKKN